MKEEEEKKNKKNETHVTLCFISFRSEENRSLEKAIVKSAITKKRKEKKRRWCLDDDTKEENEWGT